MAFTNGVKVSPRGYGDTTDATAAKESKHPPLATDWPNDTNIGILLGALPTASTSFASIPIFFNATFNPPLCEFWNYHTPCIDVHTKRRDV